MSIDKLGIYPFDPNDPEIKLAYVENMLSYVNDNYPADKLFFDVEYNDHTFQADPKSFSEMIYALSIDVFPDNYYWIDKENNKVIITKEDLQNLVSKIAKERFRIFNEHQERKNKIRNATQITDLFE